MSQLPDPPDRYSSPVTVKECITIFLLVFFSVLVLLLATKFFS